MKTHELIAAPESELVPLLRQMKIKELERHASKILHKFGAEYPSMLAAVTREIPELDKGESSIFARFQETIRQRLQCADSAENRELIKRLTVIMVLVVQKQFQKIHESR
jgi:hypothetical protein